MVNAPSDSAERRERPRASAEHAPALGAAPSLNPFGDLATLQHLSARLAKGVKGVFEPVLRRRVRSWAEPLVVQRWADYRAERPQGLTAWLPFDMGTPRGRALLAIDGKLTLEMLDCFFGGDGEAPSPLPGEFTPAAEALVGRIGQALARPLDSAWEPIAPIHFTPAPGAGGCALAPDIDGEAAMIVTRFGMASGSDKPVYIDILYPVSALKPHAPSLTAKVHGKDAEVEPQWRNGLTRAVMGVRFPVRSVLAEPVMRLGDLLALKPGDVIPIEFGPEVPVMVARQRLGNGQVGTANGNAAIKLLSLEPFNPEDLR